MGYLFRQTLTYLLINASIIQGSGLGPVCCIFNCSDLHTVHSSNLLVKYADDTYLIIHATNSSLIPDELNNITQWASASSLKLNPNKSYEMIIHHSSRKITSVPPPPLEKITRTHELTILGVRYLSASIRRI